ncbi:MAG TPA: hypothetical protein DIT04_11710 [Dysgonomonas sp.]|nr:hypothetical protein [Dysgonomonas sp.]
MKKIILCLSCILVIASAYSQNYNRNPSNVSVGSAVGFDKSRLTFGGGLGLQFGSYTVVNIAPQVGYNFSNNFNAGAGISYSYYKDDFYYGNEKWDEKRHYAGFNLYARYYPIQYIVLSVQPEANRMWLTQEPKGNGEKYTENKFVPSVTVGAGVRFGPMMAMIKYDVVQDKFSPYGNSIFYSIGWGF